MKISPFELERWLPSHTCKYDLAGSVVKSLKLNEVVESLPFDLELMHGPTNGSVELRKGVSRLYKNTDEDNVLIVNGTTEGNFLTMSYLLEPGDEVVLGGVPTYLQSVGLAEALGAKVKFFNLAENEGFKADINSISKIVSKKTKMIILISPNNPTGSRFSPKEIRIICDIAKGVDAYVLADEVLRYTELDGNPSLSPAEIYEKGISTGSLSKIGLAGLRTGWVVTNKELAKQLWAQKDYTTLANPILSDYIAEIALQEANFRKIVQRARRICSENLKIFAEWVKENGHFLTWVSPSAGAVAFPKYDLAIDSVSLCKKLMKDENILLTPGDYFSAPKHLRIQYGGVDKKTLHTVLERLSGFLNSL